MLREIADSLGNRLSDNYFAGSFGVLLPPEFTLLVPVAADGSTRLTFGNADGTPVIASQLAGLEVFVSSDLGQWTRLDNALLIADRRVHIADDTEGSIRFYRIRRIGQFTQ
ncbi:MAG: hypothetical protein ACPGVU_05960 [Limisphaerales bacterium]